MSEEKKVIHEVKLDKSIIKLLWVFAVVLLLNVLPKDMIIPEAQAQLVGFLEGNLGAMSMNIRHSGVINCNGCN